MTDQDMFRKWKKVTEPLDALKAVQDAQWALGGDPYYNDILSNLMDMVERVIKYQDVPALNVSHTLRKLILEGVYKPDANFRHRDFRGKRVVLWRVCVDHSISPVGYYNSVDPRLTVKVGDIIDDQMLTEKD